VSGFKLILLANFPRPARVTDLSAGFALIPFRSRAVIAAEQIVADFLRERWVTPKRAVEYAAMCVGSKGAQNAVWQRLQAGMIEAGARYRSYFGSNTPPDEQWEPDIPPSSWTSFVADGSDLWEAGDAKFYWGQSTVLFVGVLLSATDLKSSLPDPIEATEETKPAPAATPARERGGRPRKDFWDELWVDICVQIYEAKLIPKRQADIEKAMLDWATKHGHDLSEATVRPRAKMLFSRLKTGG
jgi:hypothetical protein